MEWTYLNNEFEKIYFDRSESRPCHFLWTRLFFHSISFTGINNNDLKERDRSISFIYVLLYEWIGKKKNGNLKTKIKFDKSIKTIVVVM